MGTQLLAQSAGQAASIQVAGGMPSPVELWENAPGEGRLLAVLEGGPQPQTGSGFVWSGQLWARASWIGATPFQAFVAIIAP